MSQDERPVAINISGIPVAGIGGLGLVAMAVLVSVVMPAAWWTMIAGLSGGVVLAVVLVIARRHIKSKGPSGDDPAILFRVPNRSDTASEPAPPPAARHLNLAPRYSTR